MIPGKAITGVELTELIRLYLVGDDAQKKEARSTLESFDCSLQDVANGVILRGCKPPPNMGFVFLDVSGWEDRFGAFLITVKT